MTGIRSDNLGGATQAVAAGGTVTLAGQYGVLTIHADGRYEYTRNAGSPGGVSEVFTYTLTDGDSDAAPATLTIAIGNKRPLASLGIRKEPLVLEGSVQAISDGRFTIAGPIYTGQTVSMGRTVLFDTGRVRLVVTERTQEPLDLGVFACVSQDATQPRFLLLKSRMYCRPVFEPLARGVIECDGRGVTSSDYRLFPFRKVRRPVYPLDADAAWSGCDRTPSQTRMGVDERTGRVIRVRRRQFSNHPKEDSR